METHVAEKKRRLIQTWIFEFCRMIDTSDYQSDIFVSDVLNNAVKPESS